MHSDTGFVTEIVSNSERAREHAHTSIYEKNAKDRDRKREHACLRKKKSECVRKTKRHRTTHTPKHACLDTHRLTPYLAHSATSARKKT